MSLARVLIVAGSDSGGGAGIQADIKTVAMLGGHPMTAVTALTAQNTLGIQEIMPVPAEFVVKQMRACIEDIGVDAVKVGMIGSGETACAVADVLEKFALPTVFDPIMVATTGSMLADESTIAAFSRLMSLATVVTPNLPELAALGGEQALTARGITVLIKGGHCDGPELIDRLVSPNGELGLWADTRIDTPHHHGTGCTLASGIAVGVAQGLDLVSSVARARDFVRAALRNAPALGRGNGPVGHSAQADAPWQVRARPCHAGDDGSHIDIRPGRPSDVPLILELILGLAAYYREAEAVRITADTLYDLLFGGKRCAYAILAEEGGAVVGIALWFLTFSTWTGQSTLYLEDLFVRESHRGAGVGARLMRALAQAARDHGCGRMDWAVLDWNADAKRFCSVMGGVAQAGWEPWRMDLQALRALAERDDDQLGES